MLLNIAVDVKNKQLRIKIGLKKRFKGTYLYYLELHSRLITKKY